MGEGLTHIDETGRARMVDVSAKSANLRRAVAEGRILMQADTLALALSGTGRKGEVMAVAELAGIMAAKKTGDLIPLCHPLPLNAVNVRIAPLADGTGLSVEAEATVEGKTGVEMEAMTAVSVALLTLYDMLKAHEKGMRIEGVRLLSKSGGKSGDWIAP